MSKKIVEHVIGPHMTSQIWTGDYLPAFPFTLQDFEIGALLPAVLYMFRWGHRRGKGKFNDTFPDPSVKKATIASVVEQLTTSQFFDGFDDDTAKAILGDLLLTYVLENKRHAEGRTVQVQRIFPTHYMASWIDLPESVAHLRGVPEMLVALIADQNEGANLVPENTGGRFPVGCRIKENELLRVFARGTTVEGDHQTNLSSDRFDEETPVGLDQLATVRIAQACRSAPLKASGTGNPAVIPNRRPIATVAARQFREDLVVFLRAYGGTVPRLSLLPMLESALALNLTNVFLSTSGMLEFWLDRGRLPDENEQQPWPLFVDCSLSMDRELRQLSERSMDTCRNRLAHLPTILMYLRLLDWQVRYDFEIPRDRLPPSSPDARAWLDLLGSIAVGTHDETKQSMRYFRKIGRQLANHLEQKEPGHPALDVLRSDGSGRNQAWRLAEAIILLSASLKLLQNSTNFLNGCLMADKPNGIARRRRVTLGNARSRSRTGDVYSIVLSNTALEFLVHRHLRRNTKDFKPTALSLPTFIELLRDRYGLYVDQAPPDLPLPNELLQRNRRVLERRLRDLGLLVGVNDAESMKRLRQRFPAAADQAVDQEVTAWSRRAMRRCSPRHWARCSVRPSGARWPICAACPPRRSMVWPPNQCSKCRDLRSELWSTARTRTRA